MNEKYFFYALQFINRYGPLLQQGWHWFCDLTVTQRQCLWLTLRTLLLILLALWLALAPCAAPALAGAEACPVGNVCTGQALTRRSHLDELVAGWLPLSPEPCPVGNTCS